MTKKEELLEFVELNVDEFCTLQFNSIIQQTGESCTMTVGTRKERILTIITENFTDNLVGHMPNDSVIHEILNWTVIGRYVG